MKRPVLGPFKGLIGAFWNVELDVWMTQGCRRYVRADGGIQGFRFNFEIHEE